MGSKLQLKLRPPQSMKSRGLKRRRSRKSISTVHREVEKAKLRNYDIRPGRKQRGQEPIPVTEVSESQED
jgi:hypothetical protein